MTTASIRSPNTIYDELKQYIGFTQSVVKQFCGAANNNNISGSMTGGNVQARYTEFAKKQLYQDLASRLFDGDMVIPAAEEKFIAEVNYGQCALSNKEIEIKATFTYEFNEKQEVSLKQLKDFFANLSQINKDMTLEEEGQFSEQNFATLQKQANSLLTLKNLVEGQDAGALAEISQEQFIDYIHVITQLQQAVNSSEPMLPSYLADAQRYMLEEAYGLVREFLQKVLPKPEAKPSLGTLPTVGSLLKNLDGTILLGVCVTATSNLLLMHSSTVADACERAAYQTLFTVSSDASDEITLLRDLCRIEEVITEKKANKTESNMSILLFLKQQREQIIQRIIHSKNLEDSDFWIPFLVEQYELSSENGKGAHKANAELDASCQSISIGQKAGLSIQEIKTRYWGKREKQGSSQKALETTPSVVDKKNLVPSSVITEESMTVVSFIEEVKQYLDSPSSNTQEELLTYLEKTQRHILESKELVDVFSNPLDGGVYSKFIEDEQDTQSRLQNLQQQLLKKLLHASGLGHFK